MARPRSSTAVDCPICNTTIGRRGDLARHLRIHARNKDDLMHACTYVGCTYKTLQRSNLATHLNVHSRERPHKCPADGCDFSSSDPGSLTRHRKEVHAYEPKANSGNHPSAIARKAARQRRRISPYATSSPTLTSSSGPSMSPRDPSSSPQTPQTLDLNPPSSLLVTDKQNIKNTFAAYNTELITKLSQANDPTQTPNAEPKNFLPLTSELLAVPEAPTVEYPQLPVPVQADLHAIDSPAQPVSETIPVEVSEKVFDNFLARFDDWAVPAHTAALLPTPVVEHTVGDTPVPIPTYLPAPVVQYAINNVPGPIPTSLPAPVVQYTINNVPGPIPTSLPTPAVQCTINNVPAPIPAYLPSYEYAIDNASYSYPTAAVPFDARFSLPCSFAAPDMGYPQVIDQTYFNLDPAPAPAATGVFPMQGLYLH